jgi:hypothetical protein
MFSEAERVVEPFMKLLSVVATFVVTDLCLLPEPEIAALRMKLELEGSPNPTAVVADLDKLPDCTRSGRLPKELLNPKFGAPIPPR